MIRRLRFRADYQITNTMWKRIIWIFFALISLGGVSFATQPLQVAEFSHGIVFAPTRQFQSDSTICVINTTDKGPHWFLLNSNTLGGNRSLGTQAATLPIISDIKASEDGKYLAILSVGEGHSHLEVINLPQFLEEKTYTVLQQLDPYPGAIALREWKAAQLHFESDMLLTQREASDGRVSPELQLSWNETFALHIATGVITGVSDGAKDPAEHYMQVLLNQTATSAEKDAALVKLLGLYAGDLSLPYLLKVLDQEQDPKRINKILDAINNLRQ